MANVVLIATSDDSRLLLRGLLRLHRQRILAEGESPELLSRLPTGLESLVVLLDVDLAAPMWSEPIRRLLAARKDVRVVGVLPGGPEDGSALAERLGLTSWLRRPFSVRDFVRCLDGDRESPTPSGTVRQG